MLAELTMRGDAEGGEKLRREKSRRSGDHSIKAQPIRMKDHQQPSPACHLRFRLPDLKILGDCDMQKN